VIAHPRLGAPRRSTPRRLLAGLLAASAVAVSAVAVSPAPAQASVPAAAPAVASISGQLGASQAAVTKVSTRTLLSQLSVRAEHSSGYARSKFRLWVDADHDRCNTRAEVLIAEARTAPRRSATCALTGGRWVSSYDGRTFASASGLDIDHVVPLAEAWQSGAHRWTTATRTAYANDLGYARSLVAVSASANRSKGEKEPQSWMPARSGCSYVTSWVAVKWRWKLSVNSAERAYAKKKLTACHWPRIAKPARATVHTGSSAGGGGSSSGNDPRYSTCAEARSHGYGPYRSGVDPEYAWYTDRDQDGVVCE
jgi:Excalibur calcium-binding domain/Protein of unknown function (DUF1524)